jgi:hypothetical protein
MGAVSRGPWFCLALRQAKRCFLQRRVMESLRARQLPPATWLLEVKQLSSASTSLRVKRLPSGWRRPSLRRLRRSSSWRWL